MKKATSRSALVDVMTMAELCRFCHTDETWIVELVEHGVLNPEGASASEWHFRGINIARAKKARRLNRDLGINTAGVAMVLDLLAEREAILRKLARHREV
ncbi:MAG: chaperone modulator CbpM [Roseovarius sp.]